MAKAHTKAGTQTKMSSSSSKKPKAVAKSKAKVSGAKPKKKKLLTPQQKAQRKQIRECRLVFQRFGFEHVKTDGLEFNFLDRTGEFDDCFVFENIAVFLEYTVGSGSSHPLTKKVLFDKVLDNQEEWIGFFKETCASFNDALKPKNYDHSQYRVFIVYFAEAGVSDEVEAALPRVKFLTGPHFRYFQLLSKTLHKTARFEVFKYLGLPSSDIGQKVLSSSSNIRQFNGYLLPESHSSFPPGFRVTSFYADPSSLMRMSYVLRRDSWRDGDGLYQRILMPTKIRSMRRYLAEQQRVFVNNVVVTLPSDTALNDPDVPTKNLDPKLLTKVQPVTVTLTDESNSIGVVDGQHRIYCYHEGSDKFEATIAAFREKQNLLVTGVIFPSSYAEPEQLRFQAKLFLEINDEQTGAKSDLKQAIELILNPYSTSAIAKAIVMRLAHSGPLKELLQVSVFDEGQKIKTTSIVSYGLRPLVKFEGPDSLFGHWPETNRALLKGAAESAEARQLLEAYVLFCAEKINDLFLGAKLAQIDDGVDTWKLIPNAKTQFLTPTVINGFLVCLRLLAENNLLQSSSAYRSRLAGLSSFPFKSYKSSQWRKMGERLFEKYF
jgi:DGQHR domain-containing protein